MSIEPAEGRRWSWDVAVAPLYVVAIFVVGSLPSAPPVAHGVSDKLQHAIGFGLLAWLWCRAFSRLRPGAGLARIVLVGFSVSAIVGGALELWQGVLSYRTCEFLDWVADGVGAALAGAAYAAVQQWFGTRARAVE